MGIHHRRLLIVQTQTPQKAEAPWTPSLTRQCLEYYLQDQLLMAVPIRPPSPPPSCLCVRREGR